VTFVCAALVCSALVPVIIRFARRHGLFDHITSTRKMHSARVPRLGGIAIVAGFYAPLLALILYPTGLGSLFYADASRAFAFLFGGLAIAALGIFDDIFGAGAVEKFFVQIAVALYMWWAGFRIEQIHLVGGVILPLGLFGVALTVIWIVGVMNALNLIDGLDGLAAGIALATVATNFLIAGLDDQPLMGLWMAALAGALLAFASLEHYCCERLGMGERTVQQRIALERKLHDFPSLRQAMRDGRVSYEKARLIARPATAATVDALIDRARQMTCIELRRELEAKEEVQMCAKGEFALVAPRRVVALLDLAIRAAHKEAGRSLPPGECLRMIARHFIEVWKPILPERNTLQKQVLARDKGFCQVPGCSRAAEHAHHIDYLSAGGADEAGNLISLCATHHLHGVHMGYIRVRGKAPNGLRWQLGVRLGKAPLVEVVTAPPGASG
jgi:hypothetical protein